MGDEAAAMIDEREPRESTKAQVLEGINMALRDQIRALEAEVKDWKDKAVARTRKEAK